MPNISAASCAICHHHTRWFVRFVYIERRGYLRRVIVLAHYHSLGLSSCRSRDIQVMPAISLRRHIPYSTNILFV